MRRIPSPSRIATALVAAALAAAACSGGDPGTGAPASGSPRPAVVVTTAIWGDVLRAAYGDVVEVDVIMPAGADPHDFAPSTRQAERMERADVLVVNGSGLEAGMTDVIAAVAATGTPVITLAELITPLGADPHIWMDPTRVATAVERVGAELVARAGLDAAAVDAAATAAADRLVALDRDIESTLQPIPPDRRRLVTDHESFGYFADRYGLTVVGTVIGSTSTSASASAGDLAELAALIDELDLPAIFTDAAEPSGLAQALADDVGGVDVVELYAGSLGPPGSGAETYPEMMRTTAERIAAALTPAA